MEREGEEVTLRPNQLVMATGMSGLPNLPAIAGMDVFKGVQHHSSTHVVRSEPLMELGLGPLYSEEALAAGVTTERADMTVAPLPYRIRHEWEIPVSDRIRERDADLYERLERVGFKLDFGHDNSGLSMKYLRRGSGYYIDVGASELIASGEIKLQSGTVDHLTEHAVVMADGSELRPT